MALIRPTMDLEKGVLRVEYSDDAADPTIEQILIEVPLSKDPRPFETSTNIKDQSTRVCGDMITAKTYQAPEKNQFFSEAVGVPYRIARYPPNSSSQELGRKWRGVLGARKAAVDGPKEFQSSSYSSVPGSFPTNDDTIDEKDSGIGSDSEKEALDGTKQANPILLANESPILVVSRASVALLNEQIKSKGLVPSKSDLFPDRFCTNVVISPLDSTQDSNQDRALGHTRAYEEDDWCDHHQPLSLLADASGSGDVQIPTTRQVPGACRRCQIVCVTPKPGDKDLEGKPFATLAKTRREP